MSSTRGISAGTAAAVRSLMRRLIRSKNRLPREAQTYYDGMIRNSFRSHSDEDGDERIAAIISRADEDMQWILRKYDVEDR